LAEYDLKKTNVKKRENWAGELVKLIEKQKKII
jgi:hypothetical protein